MKKVLVLLVVVAMTCISAMAFAASEISVSGSIDVRSRDFNNMDMNKDAHSATDRTVDTQERVRLAVDAKVGDVKGRIQIENDEDTWGRMEQYMADGRTATPGNGESGVAFLMLREAWINFNVPGIPVGVKAGHQFLQLGHGWFFRAMKYGSDAWVVYNDTGANHLGFVNVKVSEGDAAQEDDIDAYVIVDTFKLDDNNKIGIDITSLQDRRAGISSAGTGIYNIGGGNPYKKIELTNIGLNYTGKLGPLALKAEADFQMGKASVSAAGEAAGVEDTKFKGNQIVIQGSVPVDPVTVNFTVARGSGNKSGSSDADQIVTALDADPHYAFMFEYKLANKGAVNYLSGSATGGKGFANVTALNVGAMFAALPSVSVGADIWLLQSTEKVADVTSTTGETTSDLGNEIDVKVNWKLADNLTWNWTLGYFDPGKGMGKDAAMGAQGVLMLTF